MFHYFFPEFASDTEPVPVKTIVSFMIMQPFISHFIDRFCEDSRSDPMRISRGKPIEHPNPAISTRNLPANDESQICLLLSTGNSIVVCDSLTCEGD